MAISGPSGPVFVAFRENETCRPVANRAKVRAMNTWTTFEAMTKTGEIRLDLLESDGKTAGWIVRRACNVYQAFTMPEAANDPGDGDQVMNFEVDGVLLGIYPNAAQARQAVVDELELVDVVELRVV